MLMQCSSMMRAVGILSGHLLVFSPNGIIVLEITLLFSGCAFKRNLSVIPTYNSFFFFFFMVESHSE